MSDRAPTIKPSTHVRPARAGADVVKLLEDVRMLVDRAPRLPFSNLIWLDDDRFQMSMLKLEASLPEELKHAAERVEEAERLVQEARDDAARVQEGARQAAAAELERGRAKADNIIEKARAEVQRMTDEAQKSATDAIAAAKTEADKLLSESDVLRRAEVEADEKEKRIYEKTRAVREGADDYARGVLESLETTLKSMLAQIEHGRDVLRQGAGD